MMAGIINRKTIFPKPAVGFRKIESPNIDELALYMVEHKAMPTCQLVIAHYTEGIPVINSSEHAHGS